MRSFDSQSTRPRKPSGLELAWEALKRFVFKTLLPLTPLAVLIYFLLFTNNKDISGTYIGTSPVTGTVELRMQVDDGNASGEMIQRGNLHYPISAGKVEGESKIQLAFRLPKSIELDTGQVIDSFSFRGEHHAAPVTGISREGNLKPGDYIEGTFYNGIDKVPLVLRRNMANDLMQSGRRGIHQLFGRQH